MTVDSSRHGPVHHRLTDPHGVSSAGASLANGRTPLLGFSIDLQEKLAQTVALQRAELLVFRTGHVRLSLEGSRVILAMNGGDCRAGVTLAELQAAVDALRLNVRDALRVVAPEMEQYPAWERWFPSGAAG